MRGCTALAECGKSAAGHVDPRPVRDYRDRDQVAVAAALMGLAHSRAAPVGAR
jgi:hypothetical protein